MLIAESRLNTKQFNVFILEGSGLLLYSLNQAVLVAVVVVIIIELSLFLSVNM